MNKKGFTLIEVMIGLIILAIGLLAIAGMEIASTRGTFSSKNLTEGTYIAQDRLEFLKNLSLTSAQLQAGNYNDGAVTITVPGSYSSVVFNRSYTVVVNGDLTTITYMVTWNDRTNHNVTLSTFRSQWG
jgi:type IV pilus assembly protein PilV